MENVISLNYEIIIIIGSFIIYTLFGIFIGKPRSVKDDILLIITNIIYTVILVLLAIAESNNYSQ